jgi:hypothetical protein
LHPLLQALKHFMLAAAAAVRTRLIQVLPYKSVGVAEAVMVGRLFLQLLRYQPLG